MFFCGGVKRPAAALSTGEALGPFITKPAAQSLIRIKATNVAPPVEAIYLFVLLASGLRQVVGELRNTKSWVAAQEVIVPEQFSGQRFGVWIAEAASGETWIVLAPSISAVFEGGSSKMRNKLSERHCVSSCQTSFASWKYQARGGLAYQRSLAPRINQSACPNLHPLRRTGIPPRNHFRAHL